ncbi:MAG: beta-N-acetylglucosaminidase domain-containing protein, partial [Niameybacter sp.]
MLNNYEIFPVPQVVTYEHEQVKISEKINIVLKTSVRDVTLSKLKQVLSDKEFEYTIGEELVEGQTQLYLIGQEGLEEYDSINQKEGYRLSIGGMAHCNMCIAGVDQEGLYYGVVTLGKILSQIEARTVQKLVITDYPEILYRGYIEGFYGFPWSHEDRKDLMVFGGEYKLNTYIYAPKDDPYHRSDWRALYPENEARQIAELAEVGHQNNLNFVWTIHPGDSIDLDSEEDFIATIHKLEQLYALGVRQFGVLFDDIGGYPDGEQQARYINRVDTEFIKAKGDVRPLLTVGTRYCEAWGPSMEKYFKPFVEDLHEDVEIMWTGSATMSTVSKEKFDAPKRMIQSEKNLSVWWNYPVNDYCDAKILMGKIETLSPDVDNINGFFSNPMNQAQASKQALFCIADHNWNTDAFDSEASFAASFKAIAPEVAEALQRFASHCCHVGDEGDTFYFDESWTLRADIEAIEKGLGKRADLATPIANLMVAFKEIETAVDTIDAECTHVQLMKELRPFLDATRLMVQAGQNMMYGITAFLANDIASMEEKNEVALRQVEAMQDCKVLRLKDGVEKDFTVEVGTLLIKPFLEKTLKKCAILAGIEQEEEVLHYDRKNIALAGLGVSVTCSNKIIKGQEPEKVIEGTIKSGKWCTGEFRPYLTLDLKEVKVIKQYRIINCGHPEAGESGVWNTKHLQILTSIDGESFTLVDEVTNNQNA